MMQPNLKEEKKNFNRDIHAIISHPKIKWNVHIWCSSYIITPFPQDPCHPASPTSSENSVLLLLPFSLLLCSSFKSVNLQTLNLMFYLPSYWNQFFLFLSTIVLTLTYSFYFAQHFNLVFASSAFLFIHSAAHHLCTCGPFLFSLW